MAPQAGKVRIQAANNSEATLGFTPFRLKKPLPIMAHALEWVVLAGIPKNEQKLKIKEEAASEALPLAASRSVNSHPTFLTIREPPNKVPKVIVKEQIKTTERGRTAGGR